MKKRLLLSITYMSCALLLCGTLTYSWFMTKNNVTNIIQTNGDIDIKSVDMTFYKFLPGNSNSYPFYVDRYIDSNGIVIANTISLDNKNNINIGKDLIFDKDEDFTNADYDSSSMPIVDNIQVSAKYPFSLGVYDPYLQFVYGSKYTNSDGKEVTIDYHTRLVIKINVEVDYKYNFDFSLNLKKSNITLAVDTDDLSNYIAFTSFKNDETYSSNREVYNGITTCYNNTATKTITEFNEDDEITVFSSKDNSPDANNISFYIFADYNKDKIYKAYKDYSKESLTSLIGGYVFDFEATQSEIWEGND